MNIGKVEEDDYPINDTDFDTPHYHIDSISKLLEIASRRIYTDKTFPSKWLYRGEAKYDRDGGLLPSIGRKNLLDDVFKGNKEKLRKFEEEAFIHFKIKTYNELRYDDDYSFLAAAQHHGLKTRLLDWTLNILVGLYFAVEDYNRVGTEGPKDGALYAYQLPNGYKFNNYPKSETPFNLKGSDCFFLYTPYISPRIKAQQGVFQLFTNPFVPYDNVPNLIKLRVLKNKKEDIKRQLYEMGVHAEMLFPDLDGVCKSINYFCLNT